MSPECGRALHISQVIAMCGMCIGMWTCKFLSISVLYFLMIYVLCEHQEGAAFSTANGEPKKNIKKLN